MLISVDITSPLSLKAQISKLVYFGTEMKQAADLRPVKKILCFLLFKLPQKNLRF